MGTSCACLKSFNTEDQQINSQKEDQKSKALTQDEQKLYPVINVINIQSFIRGYLERRCRKELNRTPMSSSPFSITNRENLRELAGSLPDFSNTATLAAERKLGPYVYGPEPVDYISKVKKNAIKLENGAIYIGE